MKQNTYLNIEIYALFTGLVGAYIVGLAMIFWPLIAGEALQIFGTGQLGASVLMTLIVFGFIGTLFFALNVYGMRIMLWQYRLIGFAVFYATIAFIGIYQYFIVGIS